MKVGIALNMLSEPGRPDVAVVVEHLAMGDLAEPLGFDSLFALEHHFTGYAMSPAPLSFWPITPAAPSGSCSARRSSCCRGTTRSASPRRSRCSTSSAAGAACSALAAAPRASNTRGSASRWRRRGRALPRRRRLIRKALREHGIRVAGRVLPDPAHIDPAAPDLASRESASMPRRSARNWPRSWRSSASAS